MGNVWQLQEAKNKFNVKATLSNDPEIQDRDYAVLIIKPEIFVEPPEFPTEEITIKLYKGWNLISLPGKLVKFSDGGCTSNKKLLGFVYLKEKQEYVTEQVLKFLDAMRNM